MERVITLQAASQPAACSCKLIKVHIAACLQPPQMDVQEPGPW